MLQLLGATLGLCVSIVKLLEEAKHNKKECGSLKQLVETISVFLQGLEAETLTDAGKNALCQVHEQLLKARNLVARIVKKPRVWSVLWASDINLSLLRTNRDLSNAFTLLSTGENLLSLNQQLSLLWELSAALSAALSAPLQLSVLHELPAAPRELPALLGPSSSSSSSSQQESNASRPCPELRVAFKVGSNGWLRASGCWGYLDKAPQCCEWEKFTLEGPGNNYVALRTAHGGYVAAGPGGTVTADGRRDISAWKISMFSRQDASDQDDVRDCVIQDAQSGEFLGFSDDRATCSDEPFVWRMVLQE